MGLSSLSLEWEREEKRKEVEREPENEFVPRVQFSWGMVPINSMYFLAALRR